MVSQHIMLIRVYKLSGPFIQTTLNREKEKCSQTSEWNQSTYYLLSIKCIIWTAYQIYTAQTTCQKNIRPPKCLWLKGISVLSAAWEWIAASFWGLIENKKGLGSELHIRYYNPKYLCTWQQMYFLPNVYACCNLL